jgi:hypothetical protein
LEAQRVKVLHPTTAILDRTVTVALQPGIIDASAPPGGMLYNLQGRPQDAPQQFVQGGRLRRRSTQRWTQQGEVHG